MFTMLFILFLLVVAAFIYTHPAAVAAIVQAVKDKLTGASPAPAPAPAPAAPNPLADLPPLTDAPDLPKPPLA